ncbi:MAG TPA: hypothetical protein VKH19_09510 [Gemmatimonadaceae bacterium]|nr:hypothetical protein [Gemmatimonadaceae bacterium]
MEWFNLVDSTYRSDLRDINELNFARFDAKMEQRLAQLEAKLEQRVTQSESALQERFVRLESRVDVGLAEINRRLDMQNRLLLAGWGTLIAAVIGWLLKSL